MTAAAPIDLHELANLPFAGKAAAALVAAGLRLPVEMPEDYKLFRVEIDVTVARSGKATLIIAAEDEDAALSRADEADAEDLVNVWRQEGATIKVRRTQEVSSNDALQMIRTERLPLEIDE